MWDVVSVSASRSGARSRAFRSVVFRHCSADSDVTSSLVLQLAPEQVQGFERPAAFVFGARGGIPGFLADLAASDVHDDVQQADWLAFGLIRVGHVPRQKIIRGAGRFGDQAGELATGGTFGHGQLEPALAQECADDGWESV